MGGEETDGDEADGIYDPSSSFSAPLDALNFLFSDTNLSFSLRLRLGTYEEDAMGGRTAWDANSPFAPPHTAQASFRWNDVNYFKLLRRFTCTITFLNDTTAVRHTPQFIIYLSSRTSAAL